LDELLTSADLGAINDGIANEVSIKGFAARLILRNGRLLLKGLR
jgi:hypothetical protein